MDYIRNIDYGSVKGKVTDSIANLGTAWSSKTTGSKVAIIAFILIVTVYFGLSIYRNKKKNVYYYEKGRSGLPSTDPNKDDVIEDSKIPRAEYTVEFTYDFFMYVSNWTEGMNWFRTVLCKSIDNTQFCPLIYLDPFINDLGVVITCSTPQTPFYENAVIKVPDFPLKRWTHVAVSVYDMNVDVYIDGLLAKSATMKGPAKENVGDLKVCPWEGYNGYLSKLHYVSKQLNAKEIYELSRRPVIKYGIFGVSVPNTEVCGGRTDLFNVPTESDYRNIDRTSLVVYSNVPNSITHVEAIDSGLYTLLNTKMTEARGASQTSRNQLCPTSATNAPKCPTGTLTCQNDEKYCYYPDKNMMVRTYMDTNNHYCPALGTGNKNGIKPVKIDGIFVWRTKYGKDTTACPNVNLFQPETRSKWGNDITAEQYATMTREPDYFEKTSADADFANYMRVPSNRLNWCKANRNIDCTGKPSSCYDNC